MHSFPVVVEYPVMERFDDFFERSEGIQAPTFEFQFSVIRFLMPILPWRSFRTHRWTDAVLREEIQYEEASVFASLIRVENLGNRFRFSYGILHGFEDEFLRVPKRNRVSDYFS
jgi:hypothetical protein